MYKKMAIRNLLGYYRKRKRETLTKIEEKVERKYNAGIHLLKRLNNIYLALEKMANDKTKTCTYFCL